MSLLSIFKKKPVVAHLLTLDCSGGYTTWKEQRIVNGAQPMGAFGPSKRVPAISGMKGTGRVIETKPLKQKHVDRMIANGDIKDIPNVGYQNIVLQPENRRGHRNGWFDSKSWD